MDFLNIFTHNDRLEFWVLKNHEMQAMNFTTSGYHGYKENSKFKIVGQTKRDTTFKIAKLESASKCT